MKERYGTVYKGKEEFINKDSGEVIQFDKLYRAQTGGNFVKMYMELFGEMLGLMNKKGEVMQYLFKDLNLSSNTVIKTVRELAQETKTSTKTVTETLKAMEKGNIIKRKTGVIMINPALLMRGDDNKRRFLLLEFEHFDRENELEHALNEYDSFK
ncbi:replication/maintenance protein RepL [Staphylococcus devriesei]|uniref:replication/maintenance protein RepL n=2 Tax=Staphylococcus TaxID=1279 RepID=UPI000E6999A7|nr:replication/maintenance protein RepL [Staphylococcus devriesei]HDE5067263.1 replication/maintenance protein RepL [Staphylococcus aureus]RIL70413.1 replication/maintenance protein RepL [Staphylococcus devriesei]HDE5504725.1 replication/maintenance protein RepL [Staphylococcus aureus]HDE6076204.1 replication/maintenance protein RepL [Staphylococcus aureus]HDE7663700.1 replication/maintenance protein RepL [Staphylococcus aureus]